MATVTVTIGQKYGMPPFSEEKDFDIWENEIKIWKLATDVPRERQAAILFLSLEAKIREACVSVGSDEQLRGDDGWNNLMEKLKELYGKTKEQSTYSAYENFATFVRPENMSITEYINKFEELHQKVQNHGTVLPDCVLKYNFLKNANIPADKSDLVRATAAEGTYSATKKQLKTVYDMCAKPPTAKDSINIHVEADDVFYGQSRSNNFRGNNRGHGGRGGGSRGGYQNNNNRNVPSNPSNACGGFHNSNRASHRGGNNNHNRGGFNNHNNFNRHNNFNNNSNNNYNNNNNHNISNNSSNNNNSNNNNNNNNNTTSSNNHTNRGAFQGNQFTNWRNNDTNQLRCGRCESVLHVIENCPHTNGDPNSFDPGYTTIQFFTKEVETVQFFTKELELTFLEQFVSETLNCAIVDSGCPHSVAGSNWLKCFMDTLPKSFVLEQRPS